jgi:hypothetical protein
MMRTLLLCGMTLLILATAPSPAAQTALITGLDLTNAPGPQRLTITLSEEPEAVKAFTLDGPPRLVLDISPARLTGGKRGLEAQNPFFLGVRAAQFNPGTVRVVFDLKRQDIAHRIESRPRAMDRDNHQFVISLSGAGTQPDTPENTLAHTTGKSSGSLAAAQFHNNSSSAPAPQNNDVDKKIFLFGQTSPAAAPAAQPSPRKPFDLSGVLMVRASQELREDARPEQARSFRNTVHIEGKWMPPLPANEVRDASGTYLLASVRSDYLGFGPDPSSDDYDLKLFEAYIHHAVPGWELRAGRQIVRWGKTDQISPVDNLNPQDMREFFIPDLEERKLPNWMLRARAFPGDVGPFGAIALEAVFVPFFEENEFDWTGNTWALLGVENTGLRIDEDEPGGGLDNPDYGLRVAATVAGWDLAASWLSATEKSPRLSLNPFNPKGPTLEADYRRQNVFGFEFETTLDNFGFRGEGAYFDHQTLNTKDFAPSSSPVSYWVLGLDYIGESDWYANVQLSHQHLFEYDENTLFLRQDNFYLNGELNREFLRGDLMLKLRYAVDIHDGGSFFTPEAILTHFKNLELSLGTNLFFGPKASLFGRYRDNNQLFFQAKYLF